jgi:hypothetical protein
MTQQFGYNYNDTLHLMDREIFDLLQPGKREGQTIRAGRI